MQEAEAVRKSTGRNVRETATWRRIGVAAFLGAAAFFLSSCAELDYLQAKTVAQEQRIRELEASLEQWQTAYNKLYTQKMKDNDEFQKQIKLRDQEIRRLQTIRSDRERALAASEQELKLRLQKALDTNAKLKLQINSQLKKIASLEKQIQSLKDSRKKLEKDLADAKALVQQLGSQKDAAEKARRTAEQRIKALESELSQVKDSLAERDDKIKKYEKQIADLQTSVKAASSSSETIADLQKQLEAERKKHSADVSRLKNQLAGLKGSGKVLDPNLARAKDELTKALAAEIGQKSAEVLLSGNRLIVRLQSDMLFQPTTVLLRPEAETSLRRIAKILAKYPNYQLRVEGHTDSQPVRNMPFPDNLALSSQRADNVLRFLREAAKLPQKQIRSSGCSYWIPVAPNNTPEGRRRNRRVEIILAPPE